MLVEEAPAQKFSECRLGKLVGMKIRGLLYNAQAFHCRGRCHYPSHAETRERNLRKAINVNHDVGTIELFERRNALFSVMQSRVDVIFDDSDLKARSHFQNFPPRSERN